MTFGPDHYVPVLKAKRGEKKALQQIAAPLRARMTPLIEIIGRKPDKGLDEHLETVFTDLAETAHSYTRCLLDAREIESDGPEAAARAFERADDEGIRFTPVTGISRSADVSAALAHRDNGVAIRLTREEFEAGRIPRELPLFLAHHGLSPEEVDLIVDLGPVDNELIVTGVINLTEQFLDTVPDHARWNTLTVSSCAFPQSMGRVQGRSEDFVERVEWLAWRDGLHARRTKLRRLPTFSDCGIQHPSGVEGFDPRVMQASAAIRYALPESWLLIKGESTKSTSATLQFPQLARQLVYGHLRPHFAGSAHCEGCRSAAAAADGYPRLGSPEVWRRIGTIHHITRTLGDLKSLPWP